MIVTVSVRETGPKTVTIMNQTILECHKEGFRLGRKYRTGYRDGKPACWLELRSQSLPDGFRRDDKPTLGCP
jgi:hypothetical protein